MTPLSEKIIQIEYAKDRLYLLTDKGKVYIKWDNYDGYELVAESKIKNVIDGTAKMEPKFITFLKKIGVIKRVV